MASESESESKEQVFLRLFAQTQRPLHAYILALVYDPNVAADLLQETNILLWKKFDQFERGTQFLAWAREIARRTVLHYRRTSARSIATLEPHLLEDLAVRFSNLAEAENNRLEVLSNCLQKLRESDRDLITSRYQPGVSVAGMAEKLGRPVNSVSQSLSRIRRSLSECLRRGLQIYQ
ncbi:MAG: sigma-70 family RNA polymerase sigma factor [Planctomycetales bacterium]|nr:sigma-70 family RNA polymerase sigma factor [Planctomycetales bacterium]